MTTTMERPQPGDGPEYRDNLLQWGLIVRPSIERGRWFPEMPPSLPGETADDYTNRLTGADHLDMRPYDHIRNRQCSIGYHDECSERSTPFERRKCQCPCHPKPLTIENLTHALDHIRLGASLHYLGQAFEPEHMRAIANLAIDALNGETIPPLPDPTSIRKDAAVWSGRLREWSED